MCQLPTLSLSVCMTKCAKPDTSLKQWKKQIFGQIPRTNTHKQTQQLVFPQTPRDEYACRLFYTRHTKSLESKKVFKGFPSGKQESLSQHACQTSKARKLKHRLLFPSPHPPLNILIALESGYLQKCSLSTLTLKNIQESFVVKVEDKLI